MAHSFTKMRAHLLWSTKYRQRWIDPEWRMQLFEEFAAITDRREARLICAGGIQEHVHMLVAWSPALALTDLVRDLKTWSSQWVRRNVPQCREFRWQSSFTAYTVHYQRLGKLVSYILSQEQHHGEASRVGGWLAHGWKDSIWSSSGACPLCGRTDTGRGRSPRLMDERASIVSGGPGLQPGAGSGSEFGGSDSVGKSESPGAWKSVEEAPRALPAAMVIGAGAPPGPGLQPRAGDALISTRREEPRA